jgi:hypothetical protein
MHTNANTHTRPQVRTNKRYAGAGQYTVSEVAQRVKADIGNIDVLVRASMRRPRSRLGFLRGES